MTFQETIQNLNSYWAKYGCVLQQPYDVEVGAGTMAPQTFLRALGPEPWRVAYVQPSRRPADGRYGDNPNRLFMHHQYQVILKPSPDDVVELYLLSLSEALGIDLVEHDIRLVEDNWESPTLGAWGTGWEVWLDGMEITQFTYFQQVGGIDAKPVSAELTYGLERLCMYLQDVDNVYDLAWSAKVSYGEIQRQFEIEHSTYGFEVADCEMLVSLFDAYEQEVKRGLARGLVLPAYDYVLKCSHVFNLLDSRGALGVSERTSLIGRVRALARGCAEQYVKVREDLGFPLAGVVAGVEEDRAYEGGLSVSNRQGTSLDKRDAVLEIGTEELPARLFPELINIMAESADRLLQEERVEYSSVRAYATPRRLVLYIKEVAPFGRPLVREVRGPTYGVAFDSVGEPTRAAIGFAHAQGVDVSDLIIKEEAKGKFVYAISRVPGPEAGSALKDVFTRFIRGLSFERAMRWGDGGFRFVRPIRWLLALLGGDIIDIEINDIKGDRSTSGHRFLTSGMIEVPRAEDYFDILEEAYCVVDQDKRRSIVEKGIRELAEGVGGQVAEDERLLTELTYLAEHPAPLAGGFDPDLLTLPKEVIVTSMKVHQRFFPIEDREGALLPVFAAVRDGLDTRIDAVRKGYERVLSARLKDAKFFYEEDTKSQLETYVPGLKGIVFHEGLGTVLEKTCRIVALSEAVADRLGYHDDTRAKVKRAAQLCKADLITNMVREFPELQGVMGREYALLAGENEDTARAIFEHYLPRFRGDVLPESPAGVILALVDKIDTVAGFFGIGIIPSGSEDPYALRRSISGIVSILHEREVHLPVSWLATKAVSLLETQGALTRSSKETVDDILDGLGQRARSSLIDRGIRYDLVDAAMAIGFDDVPDTHKRAEALQEASVTKEFVLACTGYTRASRLAGSIDHGAVDPSLLSEPAEKTLFDALCMAEESIRIMLREKDYSGILKALSELAEPIDVFFEDVLVMAEDENVRRNRLALLARIPSLVRAVADLGKVVEKAV